MATIQGVYLALFGRPADPLGLAFFNNATGNGANLTAIGDLASQAEYQSRFAGMSNTQIITSIYQSLYNRAPDVPGLTFFANALTNGTLSINNIAIAIYDGALGADLTIRNLKEAAANAFTTAIDTTAEINGYTGSAALGLASAFITGVITTAPTSAQVNAAVLAATTAVSTGATITMTNQLAETINGTAANETINAVLDAASPSASTGTFNTGDIVNGGNGIDTMNITVTTAGNILPAGASISGVEIININQSQAAATGIAADSFAGVQQLWQIDTSVDGGTFQSVTGVAADVTVGFRGNARSSGIVTTAPSVNTLNIAIDGIIGSTLGIRENGAGTLRTVNVSGSAVADSFFVIVQLANSVETYNFALSNNLQAGVGFNGAVAPFATGGSSNLKEINLSGSTGNITFDSFDYTGSFERLLGGSGNDILTATNANANAATLLVDGGAGNDTINFVNTKSAVAGASTLTGGAGADTFVLTGGSNLVAATSNANLLTSMTKIDFIAAEDTLNITGMNRGAGLGTRVPQNTINGVATGADLLAVTQAVANATPVGQHAFFQFGADTYLFGNIAGVGLQNTDALIQLVGVNVASLNTTNLIS